MSECEYSRAFGLSLSCSLTVYRYSSQISNPKRLNQLRRIIFESSIVVMLVLSRNGPGTEDSPTAFAFEKAYFLSNILLCIIYPVFTQSARICITRDLN